MFKSNIQYASQAKGAIGEMYLTMRLLLLGHDVANTNFTIKNTSYYDLLCRKGGKGQAYPLQVKTSFSNTFRTGMTHADFMNDKGEYDEDKGRIRTEEKVQCPWAFVDCSGTEINPEFTIFILTRQQTIDLILASEYWYLTDCRKDSPHVKPTGDVGLLRIWLEGVSGKATNKHTTIFPNPLNGVSQENNWNNIWI